MKLNAFYEAMSKPWLRKISLVMKLTTFIMLIALLQCSAKGFSQNINLNETNAPLKKVLQQINKQTGYVFFYDSKDINNKTISVRLTNASVNEALTKCLESQSLTYKIIDKTIVLQQQDKAVIDRVTNLAVAPVTITGKVVDDKDMPLPGVGIRLKGGKALTITDINGTFKIDVPNNDAVLVFSFIGFKTKELPVTAGIFMAVKLEPDLGNLNEVVVVGYGTQKKVDLTGSVSTVSGEKLNERSSPNASNLLQGRVAGLDVTQSTGQPGQDAPSFQLRGLGSYGSSTAPLILIDGVVGDLNLISGNDIESVSVLKDAASAAIYGNRAANGVILVTTKRGKKGTATINYNNDFSLNQPTRLPDLIWNSAEYMQDFNAARIHSDQTPVYTQTQIDLYKNAPSDSKEYPNFNYAKYYIGNSFSQNHHLSASGGSENTQYNIALGYLNQDGIVDKTNANRYTMLFALDSKLNKTFKVGGTVSFTKQDIVEPWLNNADLILLIYQSAPTYAPFLPDGSGRYANNDFYDPNGVYGAGHNRSPEYTMNAGNITTNNYQAKAQAYIETNITKGLTWLIKGAFDYTDKFQRNYQYAGAEFYYHADPTLGYVQTDNGGPTQVGVSNYDQRTLYLNAYTTLNYTTTIATDHHLNALAGYSVENSNYQYLYGSRSVFPINTLTQLDAGSSTGQNLGGDGYQYALLSTFGRINYDYKERYLLEINGRYDGTSRFATANRYGFFPSVSAGWRVSEESFMKQFTWLDNLKLRASYGKLGNQNINNPTGYSYSAYYPYQSILNTAQYPFENTGLSQGVLATRLNVENLKWETTKVTDVGLDLDIHHGIFSATIDYYNKITSGILSTPTVLYAVGLNAPVVNNGELQNRGFELNLSHVNYIGKDFRYNVNLLLSVNKNKLLKIDHTEDRGTNINQVGLPYNSFYLTKWTGIFNSQAEINSSPVQPYNTQIKPGDLKFADVNGDNKVDQNDRVVVSGINPDYTYSFNIGFGYKNFDLTTFWQGVHGIKRFVNAWGFDPFIQGSTPPTFFRNAWTPENHSQTVPALYTFGYGPVDGTPSTYSLRDASYLRLKNVRLTYHLPDLLTKKILLKQASVFISSDNLFTFTKFDGDPERLQSGQVAPGSTSSANTRFAAYPQVRLFTAGLNVSF